jgi:Phosphate transporter family
LRPLGYSCRKTPLAVDRTFRVLQFGSASLYSLGHGGNDAQKTMGIIAGLLFAQGHLGGQFYVPLWVVLSCQVAMALGTLFGGWRIVRTMGSKNYPLDPHCNRVERGSHKCRELFRDVDHEEQPPLVMNMDAPIAGRRYQC